VFVKRATVQFITWVCCNDVFLTDIIGYDWLKFTYIYTPKN